jgi:hypothetical protein
MIKRLSTAAIGVAFVVCATAAHAGPYYGFDGRNYGELPSAPNFGRQKVEHGKLDHSDAPRKCLKPEIRALLERVEDVFGPVEVISTCRPGATIAGTGRPSRHASGNAVDFEAGNRKGKIIDWLVANHPHGGTMTYADMSHIHIDVGQHFVSLAGGRKYASKSGGGSSRRYAYAEPRGYDGYERGYGRNYERSYERAYSRAYASESRGYSYGGGFAGSDGGHQFSGGYATMYR